MHLVLACGLFAVAALGFDDRQLAREIALGKGMAERMEKDFTVLADDEVQSEVARIGQKLVAELPEKELPYRFTVLVGESAGPMNECWPLPGGFIYVPSALILRARSEAEFAGMLAHTIVHVAQRHGAVGKFGNSGPTRMWAWNPFGMYPKEVAAQWREFEIAADVEGARLASKAGYDPTALATYLERSDVAADRLEMLRDSIRGMPAAGFAPDDFAWANLQANVRRFSRIGDKRPVPSLKKPQGR